MFASAYEAMTAAGGIHAQAELEAIEATIAGLSPNEAGRIVIEGGVRAVVILDGRAPNACLLELFTEHGAGSLIRGDD